MKQAKFSSHIVDQSLALDVYLSTLLEDVPEAEDTEAARSDVDVKPLEQQAHQFIVPVFEPKPLVESSHQALAQVENRTKLHPLSVMPEWAQHEFQALFFKVEHLILATPLTELSRTIKIDRKPGSIPGQPSWFMGLLDEHDSRIGVLDTGQLLFGRIRGSQRDLDNNPFKRILITQDKRWGLACDEILSIGRLQPEKVRWRTCREKRPWLIGTVIEELTAIVDLQELVPHRKKSI
ncbi:MAG: chemotaxis protein CheW [Gammaproteobacteria bacterium]